MEGIVITSSVVNRVYERGNGMRKAVLGRRDRVGGVVMLAVAGLVLGACGSDSGSSSSSLASTSQGAVSESTGTTAGSNAAATSSPAASSAAASKSPVVVGALVD